MMCSVMSQSKNKKVSALTSSVGDVIRVHRLVQKGSTVVVGVSGGPDSTALLHILWQLRYELGIKLIVGHFNHRLRRESLRDEQFVVRQAQKFGLTVFCERAKSAPPVHGSVEDWARQERFSFLIRLAQKNHAKAITLAHTQDDLAETVLMRILRGAGLLGLRGILLERNIQGVNFIRPLLQTSKEDVLKYLKSQKLPFVIDRTNLKTDFFRNKVRLNLLPLLEKSYNGNIRRVLANMSDSVSVDYDFINQAAGKFYSQIAKAGKNSIKLDAKRLADAHPALRRMALRSAFESLKGDLKRLTLDHIVSLEDLLENRPVGSIVDLPGLSVIKSKKFLEFK